MPVEPVTVRPREEADVPAVVAVVEAQAPASGYPVRWPLPFPTVEFVVREPEVAAWVATAGDDVVGHVSLLDLGPGWDTDAWVDATGRPASSMAAVGVLVVDDRFSGRGIGRALLARAVGHARSLGRLPVLDVVQETPRAVDLYRRSGWQVVGEARPPWLPADRLPLLLMALPA